MWRGDLPNKSWNVTSPSFSWKTDGTYYYDRKRESGSEPLELGLKSLLLLRRAEYTKKLQALKTLWVGLVDIPTNHNQVIDYHQFLDDNVVSRGDTPLADVEDSDDDSASDYDSGE